MKREIELLFELREDLEQVKSKMSGLDYAGSKKTLDVYYVDPLRDDLKPKDGRLSASFRLRMKDGVSSLAYKVDHFDGGNWLYSDEYETEIGNHGSAEALIAKLGLRELVRIESEKNVFINTVYEVVVENVVGLGWFLEIERNEAAEGEDAEAVKDEMRLWVRGRGIGVGEELNSGKPELMLKKKA